MAGASRRFGLALLVLAVAAGGGVVMAQDPAGAQLPVKRVVLYTSGVGYFEHQAQIEGDVRVDLKFNVDDVNDLLKSMVLQDEGGGSIATITYGSKDPITKTLKTFAIDLTTNPTLADLLSQVRGEVVEIEAASKIVGTIVGVERRKQPAGKDQVVEVEYLNLLTEQGLRSVELASVGRIRLVNPALNEELVKALAVLALGHATDKKTVSLNFQGQGARRVRVGYIQETPIWKTSYRLVIGDDGRPFIQGWAIVENTTEEDWTDVQLTLVSGRPISFVMNLYDPLYVPRPVVEPELFASLRPQTYGQDLGEADEQFKRRAEKAERERQLAFDAAAAPAAPGAALAGGLGRGAMPAEDRAIDLQRGVRSVAEASDVGELFQYVIESPVSLPRQQSAMLPIVQGSVEGRKVSIYNPAVHAKHPLNGLYLKNSTGLHLMQGPITVFDGGTYAGDAQIEDLPPDSQRLISYALDLDTEVAPESKGYPEQLVSVRLVKGVLYTSRKYQRGQEYTIKNSSLKPREVIIEYPLEYGWTLVTPKEPTEKTRDVYRFAVTAEPGKPAKLLVTEQQVVDQSVQLTNLDDPTIQFYIGASVVSDQVKEALREVVRRKREIEGLVVEQQQLEQQIAAISQEQARIRENMAQLERNSDLYNRYVKKFNSQEDEIEQARAKIAELVEQIASKRKALDDYLLGLELN
ncbi:MAG: DUF4139 domain-containing protein [Pirellulales bacterium]|nr:DUF4139 domain-containing protein [Pirellulales bacterium]